MENVDVTRDPQRQNRWSFCTAVVMSLVFSACQNDELNHEDNSIELLPTVSGYSIFQGNPKELIPAAPYQLYELSTELFTDYAEKQRLIKLPTGTSLIAMGDGLPDFPDGTILVKTFYYYHDKRDTAKGRRLIETRLEIKANSKWNVGTYLWNDLQTEARLITTGLNTTVNWIDQTGSAKVISYRVPSNGECATCHHSRGSVIPIGPKLRNLNVDVVRNSSNINQLEYFQTKGMLDAVSPSSISSLPQWQDPAFTVQERGRAYLEVNCAHCHNSNGYASDSHLFLSYEIGYGSTGISNKKNEITMQMTNGMMPRLGTTVVHNEGLELIRNYISSLK